MASTDTKKGSILGLTLQTSAEIPSADFNEWSDFGDKASDGPDPAIFVARSALYRAIDTGPGNSDSTTEWITIYDLGNISEPAISQCAKKMEANISQDQKHVERSQHTDFDRDLFRLVEVWEMDEGAADDEQTTMVVLNTVLKPERKGMELEQWYREEHVPMLSKVYGWQRTRLCKAIRIDSALNEHYLTLHEYAMENGLQSQQFKTAVETPRAKDMMSNAAEKLTRRIYLRHSAA